MKFKQTARSKIAGIKLESENALSVFKTTLNKLTKLNDDLLKIITDERNQANIHLDNADNAESYIYTNEQIIYKLKVFLGES